MFNDFLNTGAVLAFTITMIASRDFAPISFSCTFERQSETCSEICAQPARSSAKLACEASCKGDCMIFLIVTCYRYYSAKIHFPTSILVSVRTYISLQYLQTCSSTNQAPETDMCYPQSDPPIFKACKSLPDVQLTSNDTLRVPQQGPEWINNPSVICGSHVLLVVGVLLVVRVVYQVLRALQTPCKKSRRNGR